MYLIVIIENTIHAFEYYVKIIFKRQELLAAAVCALAFLLSLPHVTEGGSYLTLLMEVFTYRLLGILVILAIPPLILAYGKSPSHCLSIIGQHHVFVIFIHNRYCGREENNTSFVLVKMEAFHLPIERLCVCIWVGLASIVTAVSNGLLIRTISFCEIPELFDPDVSI